MAPSLWRQVYRRFASGLLHTTAEKWFDGIVFTLALIYQVFVSKPSTFWEFAEPFIWLLSAIVLIHVLIATVELWREIHNRPTSREVDSLILRPDASKSKTVILEPRPPYFRAKLMGVMLRSILVLLVLCYSVRSFARASVRTYAYLVPSSELMECQKRAFFVKIIGPRVLYNVEVTLTDKSGQTHSEMYPEVDPTPRSDNLYFWFTPATPWDEDYTVHIASRDSRSTQRLVARSVQHQIQFATEVKVDSETKPVLNCRDKLLPASYSVAPGEPRSCSGAMKLAADVPGRLDVDSYQNPDGNLTIRRPKQLPPPSDLDQQSDDRHIAEYQHQIIDPIASRYRGSRMLIYFSGGQKSREYAEEFRKTFSKNWTVKGPVLVPVGDERIIDVQMSVNANDNLGNLNPQAQALLEAFQKAGVKQRSRAILDPNVPNGWIVLWIGPRSPSDIKPDQCLPAEVKPVAGQHHACELIAQAIDCRPPLQ